MIFKALLFTLIFLTFMSSVFAHPGCGSNIQEEDINSEQYEIWRRKFPRNYVADNVVSFRSSTEYTIPLIVHAVCDPETTGSCERMEEITQKQLDSQIKALNEHFGGELSYEFGINRINSTNTHIKFCKSLYTWDENGRKIRLKEPGILRDSHVFNDYIANRTDKTDRIFDSATGTFQEVPKPRQVYSKEEFDFYFKQNTIVDPNKLLNVWVLDKELANQDNPFNSLPLGYATFPNEVEVLGLTEDSYIQGWTEDYAGKFWNDGVFVASDVFGSLAHEGEDSYIYEEFFKYGKVLSHEIGHWLSLIHTFGAYYTCDEGPKSDYCDDTPAQMSPGPRNCEALTDSLGALNACLPVVSNTIYHSTNLMDYSPGVCASSGGAWGSRITQCQNNRIQLTLEFGQFQKNVARDQYEIRDDNPCVLDAEDIQEELLLYPNPLQNDQDLNIRFTMGPNVENEIVHYQIFDTAGRLALKGSFIHNYESILRIDRLSKGLYFLVLQPESTNMKIAPQKFIVQ